MSPSLRDFATCDRNVMTSVMWKVSHCGWQGSDVTQDRPVSHIVTGKTILAQWSDLSWSHHHTDPGRVTVNHIPSQTFCVSRRYFELREINVVMTKSGDWWWLSNREAVCVWLRCAGWVGWWENVCWAGGMTRDHWMSRSCLAIISPGPALGAMTLPSSPCVVRPAWAGAAAWAEWGAQYQLIMTNKPQHWTHPFN